MGRWDGYGEGKGWADPMHTMAAGAIMAALGQQQDFDVQPLMQEGNYTNKVVLEFLGNKYRLTIEKEG